MDLYTLTRPELTRDFFGCETLGEVLKQIESNAKNNGQVVCSIEVNGNRIGEEDENRLAQCRRNEIETISYSTERPLELVIKTALDATSYLKSISQIVESVSVKYRTSPDLKAVNTLRQIIQSLGEANNILVNTKAVGLESSLALLAPKDRDLELLAWSELEINWHTALSELAIAFKKRDFILMADLLEYEVTEFLRVGSLRLELMAVRLREADGSKDKSCSGESNSLFGVST